MHRDELEKYLTAFLEVDKFKDYCPNGLQVEGRAEIRKIVTGVSACAELFTLAAVKGADAVLVHHGLIWKDDRPVYRGSYKKRIKILLQNDVSLFGFHLPLDAHPVAGNNAQLAKLLQLRNTEPFCEYNGRDIGIKGKIARTTVEALFARIKNEINPEARIFPYGPAEITTIGIVSGGAAREANQAIPAGLDVYFTGEAAEYSMNYAREEGIHYIAAGHHATERFGVIALGQHLAEKFGLDIEFIDVPNPV